MAAVRSTALKLLCSIMEDKAPCHIVMGEALSQMSDCDSADRGFLKTLVYGTVERCITIDRIIEILTKREISSLKKIIRNILRLGIYQIAYMEVPDHAAVDESVKLAKKKGFAGLSSFVNGVLREFIRRKDYFLVEYPKELSGSELLSYIYSFPVFLIDLFIDEYGEESTLGILEFFQKPSEVSIRVNVSKCETKHLYESLKKQGITVRESTLVPDCLVINDFNRLEDIDEFKRGYFTVQDVSSAMSGYVIGLEGHEKVLDLCAAPGGKTLNVYDIIKSKKGTGSVTACDISEHKLDLIRSNTKRLSFTDITLLVNDATVLNESFIDSFDVVICDLPCSGLGIIRKKPDIRYNVSPQKFLELQKLQRSILDNAFRYVKKGGKLIYSTCTLTKEENTQNAAYIQATGSFSLKYEKTFIPGEDGADGFYISVYERME